LNPRTAVLFAAAPSKGGGLSPEQHPAQHRPVTRVELAAERVDELIGRACRVLVDKPEA